MKNFLIRTITGGIYVVLSIGCILAGRYTFLALFSILLAYTLFEFYRLCKKGGNYPHTVPGIITALYFFISFFIYEMQWVNELIFLGLIPLLILTPVIELFKKSKNAAQNIAYTIFGIVYIALPFSVLNFIATPYSHSPELFMPEMLIGLFILLWANDSGAYVVGSRLGKTKMAERISPQKTWEGATGGAILAIAVSIVFFNLVGHFNLFHSIIIGMLIVIAGTLGDLTESMMKRSFGVKDSGRLLPGHGGLLDRFDSMLFAAPVYYIYISIILNY